MSARMNIVILLMLCVLGYGVTQLMFRSAPPVTQNAAPDFAFTDIAGKTHTLSDYKDKIVMLNFWASWCAPCVKEFPALLTLASNNKDMVLIALSSDLDEAAIHKFLKKQKNWKQANVIIALDEGGKTMSQFGITKLPETLLLNKKHEIARKLVGAEWEPSNVQKQIDLIREK